MIEIVIIDRPNAREVVIKQNGERIRSETAIYRHALGRWSPDYEETTQLIRWAEDLAKKNGEEIKRSYWDK